MLSSLPLLRLGSRGPDVALLQLGLNRFGVLDTPPDGLFGPVTLFALRKFQLLNGLHTDGLAGPLTWEALFPWLTGYVLRRIAPGDTLYAIARQYGASLRAVETANPGLDPFQLQPGELITVPLPFPVVPTSVPFTPAVLSLVREGLTARYPFLEAEDIGQSVMGHPLPVFRLGTGPREVFFNAAHHANEWITAPLLMLFLEDACAALAFGNSLGGQNIREIFQSNTLYLMPLVNPDGVALVTGALTSGPRYEEAEAIARRFPVIAFPTGWKANIVGVDPNLQYPAGWEEAREIKFAQGFTEPAPRDYVGTRPLEAPESRAVYDFTLQHDFAVTVSYHTQGEVIFWKYLDREPPGARALGEAMAEVSGYTLEDVPLASGYAGYKDWFILRYNRPGYTVEAGRGDNPLPLSDLPALYEKNLPLLLTVLVS